MREVVDIIGRSDYEGCMSAYYEMINGKWDNWLIKGNGWLDSEWLGGVKRVVGAG